MLRIALVGEKYEIFSALQTYIVILYYNPHIIFSFHTVLFHRESQTVAYQKFAIFKQFFSLSLYPIDFFYTKPVFCEIYSQMIAK